jgi:hypothetical protein
MLAHRSKALCCLRRQRPIIGTVQKAEGRIRRGPGRELRRSSQRSVCQGSRPMTGQMADEHLLLNPASRALYEGINACQSADQLDVAARLIWERYGVGAVNDDEASYLTSCIERRRPLSRCTSPGQFAPVPKMNARISRFVPRQRQRSPDRKASRDRRRMLGGSSALPDSLRHTTRKASAPSSASSPAR